MPPEPILSASVPRYKRHCCSFNSFRKISYCCWVVIPSLYHISPPFGSYLRMSPKRELGFRYWLVFAIVPLRTSTREKDESTYTSSRLKNHLSSDGGWKKELSTK